MQTDTSTVVNRIKVLKRLQEKADWSVQIAKIKAQKLEEINELKELELLQQDTLNVPGKVKERSLKKISERTKSIGIPNVKQLPVDSVYDNTIAAIKIRLEKQRYIDAIKQRKKNLELNNEAKRNKVVEMEQFIKQKLRKAREENMEKIKESQFSQYKSMQKKLNDENLKLSKLEEIEKSMIERLNNTKNMEDVQLKSSIRTLNSIQSKQTTERLRRSRIRGRRSNQLNQTEITN